MAADELRQSNSIPKQGRVYVRTRKHQDILEYLSFQEEVLNHVFNVAFAIAGDAVVSRLLCEPLGIDDQGPFTSHGRESLFVSISAKATLLNPTDFSAPQSPYWESNSNLARLLGQSKSRNIWH
jgi:hypothetical protein